MPRLPRNLIGSAFVHNMVQGINKEYIFQNNQLKNKYIEIFEKYSAKYDIRIIAYCIMDNHAHLLTYSENIEQISLFMKGTNTEYAIYYNKKKNRVGYVFRNRFDSRPIYDKEYLLKCIKYIHMNPVKAGIVKDESEYKFSSYKNYLFNKTIINSDILKNIFDSEKDYLKKLSSIEYESLNLEKENINIEEVLKKYLIKEKLSIEKIKSSDILIKKFISYLISNEYRFTKNDVAKAFKISRTSLYRRLKR